MQIEFGYTDKDIDFGRTSDSPIINYISVFDIDRCIMRIPYSSSDPTKPILISQLINTYLTITSNRAKFQSRPCLRVLRGKSKKQIAHEGKPLVWFGINQKNILSNICFRVEDSSHPNLDMSDVIGVLNELSDVKVNEDQMTEIIVSFQGKKIYQVINIKATVEQLKESLIRNLEQLKKTSIEFIQLLIEGTVLTNNKLLEQFDIPKKQIKAFLKRKQGGYKGNTSILLSNKTAVEIKSIKVGDKILTFNRSTHQPETSEVTHVYQTIVHESVVIKLKSGIQIQSTPNHLLLCDNGIFKLIKSKDKKQMSLSVGDFLQLDFSKRAQIVSIETQLIPPQIFYNVSTQNNKNIIINQGIVSHHQTVKVRFPDGLVQSIDVISSDSFLMVKQKLEQLYYLNSANQKLAFACKKLKDEETILDLNVPNEATLMLQKISCKTFNLLHPDTIIQIQGNNQAKTTISQLKQNTILTFCDLENKTLSKEGIRIDSVSAIVIDQYINFYLGQTILRVSPETYLLMDNNRGILAIDYYRKFQKQSQRFYPQLKSSTSGLVSVQKIQLKKTKTTFYKINSEAPNFIASEFVILNKPTCFVIKPLNKQKQKICLSLPRNTSVFDVKKMLQKLVGIPEKNQYLLFNGEFLHDGDTLAQKQIDSEHIIIVQQNNKVYSNSSIFLLQSDQEQMETKNILFLFTTGEQYTIKYNLFRDWTIKQILKEYMNIQDPSYFVLFSQVLVFSNEKLRKMQESTSFNQPNIIVMVLKNEKLSFISTIQIRSQNIKNVSAILFENKEILEQTPEQSSITVPQSQQLASQFAKASSFIKQNVQQMLLKKKFFYIPFLFFTSRKFHEEIYKCIRMFSEHQADIDKSDSMFSIIKDLYTNMNILFNHLGICYYGVRNFRGSMFLRKGHTFYWYNFTLAYKQKNNVVGQLTNRSGTLFHIQSTSGKLISKFSIYPQKNQILFAPFTYFLVEKVVEGQQMDEVWLTEVSAPVTFKKSIILWVDDNPHYNSKQYNYILNLKPQLQILQVTSTAAAEKWIYEFGWILNWKGLEFKLISDMARLEWKEQDMIENKEAGIDLIELLYKIKGYSAQTLIFCGNEARATNIAKQRQIPLQRYIITEKEIDLKHYVGIN